MEENNTVDIEQLEYQVSLRDALFELSENESFKLLIEKGYIQNLKNNIPSNFVVGSDKDKERMIGKITSIGFLERYFGEVIYNGNWAEQSLRTANAAPIHGEYPEESDED